MGESLAEQLLMDVVQNSSNPVGPCINAPQREEQYSEVLLAVVLRLVQQDSMRPDGPFCTEDTKHDQQELSMPEMPSVCTHTRQPTQLAYSEDG